MELALSCSRCTHDWHWIFTSAMQDILLTPPATQITDITRTILLFQHCHSVGEPIDAYRGANINNGRFYRHSFSYAPKRQRHSSRDDRDRESRLRCHGEDEATLRQLLLEYVESGSWIGSPGAQSPPIRWQASGFDLVMDPLTFGARSSLRAINLLVRPEDWVAGHKYALSVRQINSNYLCAPCLFNLLNK